MKLILEEDYISDEAFSIRLGVTRDDLRQVISEWPHIWDENDEDSRSNPDLIRILAINNSLNEVLYGVNVSKEVWTKWLDEPYAEVEQIYQTWAKHKGWKSTGIA